MSEPEPPPPQPEAQPPPEKPAEQQEQEPAAETQPAAAQPAAVPPPDTQPAPQPVAGAPGYPPAGAPGYPPAGAPGYPPAGAPGYPPAGAPGYPPPGAAGYPPPGAPGYPPAGAPGYPPPGAAPYGYAGAAGANFALAAQQAAAATQRPVVWMPAPDTIPADCPPGLEYLTQIDQLLVHQQIEILELVTNWETENKYRVRNSVGQQVYFANEKSTPFQRQCCGPGRKFSMSITDNSQNEVIHLERPLRCYYNCSGLTCYCCLSCCLPHVIEVQSPPGTVVGYVKQDPTGIFRPWFKIQDANEETILRIKGPTLGCSCYADANFEVLSADGESPVGRISKQWSGLAKEYFTDADNFGIQFPMDLDVKMKAVMLGACFLIDFMFFEAPGGGGAQRRR